MKVPDLSQAADAGVHEWSGATDHLKSAAGAAKLRFCEVDLHGVDNKAALLAALAKSLKLPEHFGNNWDALADCVEDTDWLGPAGIVVVTRHSSGFRKAHAKDWATLSDILGEAAEYWQERHKPFWVFVA